MLLFLSFPRITWKKASDTLHSSFIWDLILSLIKTVSKADSSFITWTDTVSGDYKYNVIPLFGKSLSDKLKEIIIHEVPPKVNVLLDNDAISDSIKICEYLLSNGRNDDWQKRFN